MNRRTKRGTHLSRKGKEKVKWWRRFWPPTIIACSVLIVAECIFYLLGYINLAKLFGGILLLFPGILLGYEVWYIKIRYQATKTMQLINRITFIGLGGFVAWFITFFGGAFIILTTALPSPADYLGPGPTFILMFIVPWIVGGFIGDRVGKRRNYRTPGMP